MSDSRPAATSTVPWLALGVVAVVVLGWRYGRPMLEGDRSRPVLTNNQPAKAASEPLSPAHSSGTPKPAEPAENRLTLEVTIDKSQRVLLGTDPIPVAKLAGEIRKRVGPGDLSADSLVINADQSAAPGLIVKVMDQARILGITRFPLSTGSISGGKS